jgi:two-component system response regulator WspF
MRIGIVNDLGLAREALRRAVLSTPGHQVVWMASDGAEAIEKTRANRPDLILMDLVMPGVDGVEATRRIMAETPCPILVVTATVSGHVSRVFDAMGFGALDSVETPTLGPRGEIAGVGPLLDKIAMIGRLIGKSAELTISSDEIPVFVAPWTGPLVLIGSSTGGPNALALILAELPLQRDACTIIVQHVDAAFAPGLAHWLSERTGRHVEMVTPGARPGSGQILLAATNDHLTMDSSYRLHYDVEPASLSYRPSVDVFFNCVATHWPRPGIASVLTGMGRDGAKGLLKLRQRKWFTIAQDQATSIVWGMPRAAAEIGAAVEVLPVDRIGQAIATQLDRHRSV